MLKKVFVFVFLTIPLFATTIKAKIHRDDFLLGLYLAHKVEAQNKVLEDHPEWDRVVDISSRILDATGRKNVYTFQIIKAPVANAFALPGGFIFITDKLLELELSDDELGFLIGHEISHVQNRHFERIQGESKKVTFLNVISTIGAMLLASQVDRNRERLIEQGAYHRHGPREVTSNQQVQIPPYLVPLMASNIFGTLYLLHSQREFELEADRSGAGLALSAGYSLEKGLGMLKKLFYTNYRDIEYLKWQSHPLTQARMTALKLQMKGVKQNSKKSKTYIETFRYDYANKLIQIYQEMDHWTKPATMKIKHPIWMKMKLLFLSRIKKVSQDLGIRRQTLRLEIRKHLEPQTKEAPFLLANYGELYEKMLELQSLGERLPEDTLKPVRLKRNNSLEIHMKNMKKATPGYKQLDFMLRNYPNEKGSEEWKWEMWLKEPKEDKRIEQAKEYLKNESRRERVIQELEKMNLRNEDHPLRYCRIIDILKTKIDSKKMDALLKKCDSLKVLAEFQHEFPEHSMLKKVHKRKGELLDATYRKGRLANVSGQYQKAVQSYHKILLYHPGTELAREAKEQIYKLNSLSRKRKSY